MNTKCMPFFDIWKEMFEPFWIYFAWPFPSGFCSRGHMVWKMMFEEFQDCCSMLDPIWHLNGIIIAFLFNPSACCLLASFCSRGYMVWKMMMFEEFHHGCLVLGNLWYANGMISGTSESPCYRMPSIKFLLKRIYGLEEDVGWRIPRWLFSARQSLVCKWDNLSYFWVSMLQEASQRVSAQEYIWFGRKCWLKNSKMAV